MFCISEWVDRCFVAGCGLLSGRKGNIFTCHKNTFQRIYSYVENVVYLMHKAICLGNLFSTFYAAETLKKLIITNMEVNTTIAFVDNTIKIV